ncbi:LytTR family DNA-binding domain-containing protein [Dyadobacter sp. CY323]|uniref:LytR/AlgR family response regulator transcription factor n=1 Tax=Dyadobacter sp. CY323 TaxID=2907302 RepID=UPI001F3EC3AB|nr:LytTR family DNA-binding domain-containing protein [Dyadobacter sp. CY323]MCE6992051.1 LytTR family DNA-binding domain-containing protein [Dyadobacter sp. CY323]
MKIRTLVVDDEPHAIDVIETYAGHLPEIEIIGTCSNAISASNMLRTADVDLMFLDVKMPGLSGTDLLRSLNSPPMVVLTTAYPDYALDGFELDIVDYLLKPIPLPRFLRAMEKVMFTFKGLNPAQPLPPDMSAEQVPDYYLYLRIERRFVKVNTKDILWIESIKDYIKVVTGNEVFVSKQKISMAEKLLPIGKFMRIHRSFIVPVDKVQSIHASYVVVLGFKVPVGRNYKSECLRQFLPG